MSDIWQGVQKQAEAIVKAMKDANMHNEEIIDALSVAAAMVCSPIPELRLASTVFVENFTDGCKAYAEGGVQ